MRRVQVGFIGAGEFISSQHLLTVRDSKITDIAAIADLDEAKLKQHSSTMKVGYTTTNYKKLLDDSKVDMIIIGTKQDLHAQMIVESLNAGKWVLCEKPMAETDEETRAVLKAEKKAKGKLAIGFNRRFAPAYVKTKQLMKKAERPWHLYYRLMAYHVPKDGKHDFYHGHERIIYEGCHVIDIVCWLLDLSPVRAYMVGDRYHNNICTFEFPDGSCASIICGSMSSFCLWKEYMEVFAHGRSITVSDFVDMRIRGFEGESDLLFPLSRGAHAEQIERFGFDYYETCRVKEILANPKSMDYMACAKMHIEPVHRPISRKIDETEPWNVGCKPPYFCSTDKGWQQSLEHFAQCFLDGTKQDNADGIAGARSTTLAPALLKSLETGQTVKL